MKKIIYIVTILLGLTICFSQTRFEVETTCKMLDRSFLNLISQVGVKEKTGHNDGKQIAEYLKSVGIYKPASYCMAGQYWAFWKVDPDKVPLRKSGVAIHSFSYAKKVGRKTAYKPQINDLIVWKRFGSWQGHVERIIEVGKAGWVKTVGFNTSNGKTGSQREGNGVFIRKRNIYYKIGRLNILGLVGFYE
jgi:hypothetical protein